jgi:hypothetical protein
MIRFIDDIGLEPREGLRKVWFSGATPAERRLTRTKYQPMNPRK